MLSSPHPNHRKTIINPPIKKKFHTCKGESKAWPFKSASSNRKTKDWRKKSASPNSFRLDSSKVTSSQKDFSKAKKERELSNYSAAKACSTGRKNWEFTSSPPSSKILRGKSRRPYPSTAWAKIPTLGPSSTSRQAEPWLQTRATMLSSSATGEINARTTSSQL